MPPLEIFGLFTAVLMLALYALESRGRIFILLFGFSCLLGAVYLFLQGAWPYGLVELAWTAVASWRWWNARPPG
ncbi:MAG: hypothetical protein GC145_10575 [Caulobacter sp.]|nr:hypothetical protein [Caulobacter sp.]